jgi:DNA-binding ferritin-like protein
MDTFKLDTSDFDRKFDELKRRANELGKGEKIRLNELLSDSFINQYSKFQSFQAMVDASGIKNPEELKGEQFSKFISVHTKFGNWEEMIQRATAEYAKRKLGL